MSVINFVMGCVMQKKKKIKEEEKKTGAKIAVQNGKKREKKVYDLPGQKRDPPEEVCFLISLCLFILIQISRFLFLWISE